MKLQSFSQSQQKVCFFGIITATYLTLLAWLDFLQGPPFWDEAAFWQSSLTFSDSLLPSLSDLREYYSLNTPLPFMAFGLLEYLFGRGIAAGRLLNLALSLGIVAAIGWPSKDKGGRALLCLLGLFLCPYFLFLSGRLYTEMIACTWVLLGLVAYRRDRPWLSCLAFVLAIASRQFMLAFPAAITTYEFLAAAQQQLGQPVSPRQHQRWQAPALACLSILGWVALFGGLAPATAIADKSPEVQKSTLALTPGGAINFLAFIGAYIVIPEWLLFRPQAPLQTLRHNWPKGLLIAAGLLGFCLIFPPLYTPYGTMGQVAKVLPLYGSMAMYYCLALLACLRFSQPGLLFGVILFNTLIMMKAIPWDRYVLPVAVAFWYLKSIHYPGTDTQPQVNPDTLPT